MKTLYDFAVPDSHGVMVQLSQFRGQVVLVVNTATECGFTPQFKDLERLYEAYKDRGLVILGFPSNDFGNQEPREGADLAQFCQINFGVSFPILGKSRVRGPYANELFKFFADKSQNGRMASSPRWNFQKYLFNRQGAVVDFYYPFTKPYSSRIKKAIEKLIEKP